MTIRTAHDDLSNFAMWQFTVVGIDYAHFHQE